jgi:hypothetical protein
MKTCYRHYFDVDFKNYERCLAKLPACTKFLTAGGDCLQFERALSNRRKQFEGTLRYALGTLAKSLVFPGSEITSIKSVETFCVALHYYMASNYIYTTVCFSRLAYMLRSLLLTRFVPTQLRAGQHA